MKKIFTLLTCLCMANFINAQSIVLSNDFNGYTGLTNSIPAGWYYSFNDTSTTTGTSYYNSSCCYGLAAPAYKFGRDSVTIITPYFASADSVLFYLKGNGTQQVQNTFYVYGSADSITWNEIVSIDSIPAAAQTVSLGISNSIHFLKFYFNKVVAGYNAGFDDLIVKSNSSSNVNELSKNQFTAFPNPAKGFINIRFQNNTAKNVTVSLLNLLGKVVLSASEKEVNGIYALDIRNIDSGVYFVRVKSDKVESIQRIIIEK